MVKRKFTHCLKCKSPVSKNCRTGYCNHCRDRTGKNNPFYGKTHNKEMIERTKKKLSKISKKLWKDKEYREKVIKGVSKPRRKEFKIEQSKRVLKWYDDNPEQRKIRSKSMRKSWQNGNLQPNDNSSSKSEIELYKILKNLLPKSIVSQTNIRINKRWIRPDILIDKNIIIEYFGNFWHANPRLFKKNDILLDNIKAKEVWKKDKKRIKILKENKYRVFIVWQDKYEKDKKKTIRKLIKKINKKKITTQYRKNINQIQFN